MFSSSTPCIVRIATRTWQCSHCDAIFIVNGGSTDDLLTAFDAHVKRKHKRPGKRSQSHEGSGGRGSGTHQEWAAQT